MIILYIFLFIVCLSTLVMIHELGHLLTAKMFKVYCFEYAIGFGPKIFSFKRKKGETYFSLRAIPFGGFVSMYGESESVPEGLEIDPSRSLLSIAKWKRAIVMVAGIAMNFLLAIVLFIIYEGCFPKYQARYAHVTIDSSSIAETVGLRSGDFVYAERYYDEDRSFIFYDDDASIVYENGVSYPVYFGLDYASLSIKDTSLRNHAIVYDRMDINSISKAATPIDISKIIAGEYDPNVEYLLSGYSNAVLKSDNEKAYQIVVSQNFSEDSTKNKSVVFTFNVDNIDVKALEKIPLGQQIEVVGKISKNVEDEFQYVTVSENNAKFSYPITDNGNWLGKKRNNFAPTKITFHTSIITDSEHPSGKGDKTLTFNEVALTDREGDYYLPENIGMNLQLDTYRNNFGETFKEAFKDFGSAGSLIYRSLGSLFTDKDAWNNVGGIIAIGVTTTRTLQENGFGAFLMYWSIISVNLGIVNLLPFPGLDGWHLLVIIVEGITRKEIPAKVKNWFSIVGLVLLFALMILVVIKDIITFI